MQVNTTSPRLRRALIGLTALLGLVAGVLLPASSDAAAKYPYKAPPSVSVANVGKDYAEIVFGTVTGAPTYKIKAEALDSKGKVMSGKTKYASTGPEGYWTITGLSPATKYKFTVAVEQPSPKKLLSKYSTKSATATTNKSSYMDAPIQLETRDDPNDTLDKNGQRPYSIDLQWIAPAGFDPAAHEFHVDYATDRVMKAKKGSARVPGTPLATPTTMQAEAPVEPAGESPEPAATAAPTDSATPAPTDSATAAPTETAPAEPASAPAEPAASPAESVPAGEEPVEQVRSAASSGPEVVLLSAPVKPAAANPAPAAYWARVTKLTSNTNLYMRVKIVRKADGAVLSERSEALMVKTLSPKGYITGKVTIPSGERASHYVVTAYKGNDLHDQASVSSDGSYQLSVRPGSYYVQAVYIGPDNHSSRWAASDPTKGKTRYDDGAKSFTVTAAKATTGVNITPQSTASYSVSGDIDCPGASSSQCTVDVAAMSNWNSDGKRSRVVSQARSTSSGGYSVTGLPPGKYKLRISHAEERYKVLTRNIEIEANGNVKGRLDGKLTERGWVKSYPAKIKRSGSTVKVTSKAWIASELPIVRAVQKCQWQRNRVNIGGATKCSYKLTAADRGKQIRVRIKQDRYGFTDGFTDGYATSKAIRG